MASTPPLWKIYSSTGEFRATCVYLEDAAMLVAALGDGVEIRHGRTLLWCEGAEAQPAGESYDYVASTARDRLTEASLKRASGGSR